MKSVITLSLILFSFLARAQRIDNSEEYILQKAELYSDAWENLDVSILQEEDRIKYKQEETSIEYFAEKAYYFYNELVEKFPTSKNYLSYLFNKARLATDINKFDDARKCLIEVIQIAEFQKSNTLKSLIVSELCYYEKLSFYYLIRICENESNCLEAKRYIAKMEKLQSDNLNEYQNSYIKDAIERINRNCLN